MMTAKATILALALALPPAFAVAAAPAPPGVAACTNCHPRRGGDAVLPPLAGRNASDIVAAMMAFRSGARPATIMDRIAKGYTGDEIAAIAAWYEAQR